MTTRQAAVVALAVLCALGAALPAATAQETTTPSEVGESAGLGDELTAFMQSSAAEANDSVESGMWRSAFESADESERARLATNRTERLADRLERLRERNRTLTARYENGSIDRSAYLAQVSQLSGRMAALRSSVNDTDQAAEAAGVDPPGLERLRSDARNATGPEVNGVARGLTAGGGPPADAPARGGPPNAIDRPETAGNATPGTGPPRNAGPNGTGVPASGSVGPANGTGGPPDDVRGAGNETRGPSDGEASDGDSGPAGDAAGEGKPASDGDNPGNEQGGSASGDGANGASSDGPGVDDGPGEDAGDEGAGTGNGQSGTGNDGSGGGSDPAGDGGTGPADPSDAADGSERGNDGGSGTGGPGNGPGGAYVVPR
ncbi:hypothetical protein [Halomicrobium urmianum]|uniref:hypothetical protein n=1 Tax=Halomicrobium urmianum TaxID=1586233 RepID=UPI001CD98B73|nr:hypothetical protein [Halomicrobium urmianum]